MKWVLSDHPTISNPDVLAIVGIDGVGKTTLAQHVYRNSTVPDCFDKKAWVCVPEKFNVFEVTKEILKGFTVNFFDSDNLDQFQRKLRDDLKGKKFLLVLDDVWNKNYWKDLLKPLEFGKEGSKILVTTQNEDVADCIKTSPSHELKKLSSKDCWRLFEKHVFMWKDTFRAHPDLKRFRSRILEKCDGLPLAAKVLGGVLRSKRDPREWREILESDTWDLAEDSILPVLKISYRFLPFSLKRCFAYCAVFPKYYEFEKNKLIRLWMAEGFLTRPIGSKDIARVGEGCFDDLVSRSFFQKSTKSECFIMHDLINDLAKSISGEFCFRYGVDRPCKVPERIRHLWVGDEEGYGVDKLISKVQHLRTLICFVYEQEEVMNLLPTFTRLRVLSLPCNELPDSIGSLMHLRYLDLSMSSIKRLPNSVVSLYNLETLILYGCRSLVELPAKISELINLSQLDIRLTKLGKMPPHMGKLEELGELDYYIVGKGSDWSIKELGPLKRLRGRLRIEKLRNVSHVQESEEANLKGKEKLKDLELIWNDDEGSEVSSVHERNMLEQLQPHTNIEKLSIYGYAGTRFPDWVGDSSFSNMVELKFQRCKCCLSLPALGQLGSLKRLSIMWFEEITVVGPEFYGKSNKPPFGCLESLTFRGMRQWREWVPYSSMYEGDGPTAAFPLLQELVIEDCPNLIKTLPAGLPTLKTVQIGWCHSLESFSLDMGPALKKIVIEECENLKCFSTAATAELEHLKFCGVCPNLNEIQPIHLLSIKRVRINACDSLESFPLDLDLALEKIEIEKCENLKWLSAASAVELEHLKRLRLHDCPKLKGIQPTHLPSLADLEIMGCDQLVSLPRAPALQRLWIGFHPLPEVVEQLMALELKDLYFMDCDSVTNLFFPLDLFPMLESLTISDYPKLESLSIAASQAQSLQRFKSLTLWGCPNLKRLLSMHNCPESIGVDLLRIIFPNLCRLELQRCCEEVESFPPENMVLPPTLTSLDFEDFPNLKSFNNTALQYITCLKEVRICNCPELQSLPKQGLPSSLHRVEISGCPLLQVGQDGPEAEIANIQQKPRQSGTRSRFWHTSGPSAMLPEPPTQNQRKLMQGRRKNLKLKEPWDKENELAPSIESGTEQHRSRTLSPRTEAEITNIQQEPMQSSTLSFLRQTGGPSAMLPEPPTQNQRKLMQGGMGLTTPPECQEWERSTEIYLMDNEFSELPETLRCPVLEALFLNRNSRLRKIPESFFNNMPALQILNLSRTRIKSLPKSLFQLINLKRLFLNHCELFMRLQPEIGKLRNLEILDLEGTRITNLPKEVQHLKTLTCLKLSFDDPVNYRKELLNEVIPRGVLSALAQLEELHIDVSPDDKRWNACVVDVASEVCGLTTLNTLKFYFPLVELLSRFNWSNPEGESLSLSHFRLTVGHHFKRIMSQTPHDIELEMEQYDRCLKYVNGAGVPEEIKVVLRDATAFFLDRHTDIKTLSELGCENMMQLNWCVVGECNEIRAIINGDRMGSWSSSEKNIGLTALEYLHIYRMKNLRSIWEGRVLDNGFTSLKALTLRTCPQLTTIFTPELLASFSNLEELLVDDCPVITALVCCDNSEHEATHFLPKLKKVSLHYLPELASISNAKGISMLPTVEWVSVYCCPKLLCLPVDKGYHTSLKKIKGERNWWEALEWTSTQQHSWDDIFVPINACD